MKKLYFALIFSLLLSPVFAAVYTLNPTATGFATTSGATSGDISVTNSANRGYAVFDIGSLSLPAGSIITSVTLNFQISSITGASAPTCTIYGYVGDISALSASAIYAACTSGTTSLYTATWGNTAPFSRTMATTAAADTIVAQNLSGKISTCWVLSASTRNYSINGTTSPVPVLTITTCDPPTTVITATPNPVCSGSSLALTSAPAATGYVWSGPGGFSSTVRNPAAFTAGTVSAGVYSLAATSSCGVRDTTTLTVTVGTSAPAAISGPTRICGASGVSATLSNSVAGGVWTSSAPANAIIDATTGIMTSVSTGATTVTYNTGCSPSATLGVTVTAIPNVSVNTTAASACFGTSVPLTASGATTYTWSPSAGLSATNTASVTASPTSTTTYTVIGTAATCTNTATSVITGSSGGNNFNLSAVGSPTLTCSGGASTLMPTITNSMYNTLTSIPYAAVSTAGTSVMAGDDDNNIVVTIPFNFYFYGNVYTSVSICTNGFINFGTPVVDLSSYSLPDASAPEGLVTLFMHDLDLGAGGNIRYQTLGTTPNRQFVVSYNGVSDYGGGATNTGQIILYETSNNIDLLIGSCTGSTGGFTMTTGIQNIAGSSALVPSGRNDVVFDATNEAWRFTGVPTSGYLYSWTPAATLSSSTASNPIASPITAATTFTVTVSDSATGCYKSTTATVNTGTISGTISPNTSICSGSSTNVVFNGPGSGTATYTINGGSPITVALNASGTATVSTGILSTRTIYQLTTVASGSCSQSITGQIDTISVVSPPTVSVSPDTATFCRTGGIALSATGTATTYTWVPSAGLSATTGSSVTASPSINTVYTVTGSIGSCGIAATAVVNVAAPFTAAAVATPTITCTGGASAFTTSLSNTDFNTVTSIPYSAVSTAGTSVLAGVDDDAINVSLPFTFYYYGTGYSSVNICTNGFINFGTLTTDFSAVPLPDGGAPEGMVALFWQDLYTYSGNIRYQTLGTAPNRRFVVSYNAVPDLGGYGNHTGQIILYETLNYIDLLIASNPATYSDVTCGVQDLTGTNGVGAPGRNGVPFSATNEAWRFTGVPTSGFTYSWSPAATLSSSTSSSPAASSISASTIYTVTVTETATGCVDTGVATVNVGTLPGLIAATADTVCNGAATNITFTGPGSAVATYTINGGSPLTIALDASGTAVLSTGALTSATTYVLTTITSGSCVQSISGQSVTVNIRPSAGAISGTSTLCTSSTFTFTNPTAGGTWTSSVTSRASVHPTSGVVTGIATGAVTISYSFGSCTPATFSLSVIARPAAITPSGAVSICEAASTTLASTTAGGIWTSSSTSVASVDSTLGVVTGIAAGSVTISYSNGCGAPRTKAVTVNTSPAIITGTSFAVAPSAICTLSSYTFTNAVSGGTWSNSPTTVGTIGSSSGTFNSGTATGTTIISYTIGSCRATASLNIGSTAPSPISGASSVCASDSTVLTDTTAFGIWSTSSSAVATVHPTNGTVYGVSAGSVTVSYSNGCGTPATASITVNGATPVLAADTICSGSDLHLTSIAAVSGAYSWAGPNAFTSTAANPTISPATTASAGTYTLTFTSTAGSCVTEARVFAVVDTLPVSSAFASPSVICAGGTATLSVSTTAPTGLIMHAIPYDPVAVSSGTNGPSGDDAQVRVNLPFTFNYYGTNYTQVRICTNGFINFGSASTDYSSLAIPTSGAPLGMIALFWQDLIAAVGDIKYTTLGSAPNRKFVVSYNAVPDLSGAAVNTGQIVLYETSNMIDLYVQTTNTGLAYTPVCGIQNITGTSAITPAGRNEDSYQVSTPGEAWRFVTPSYTYAWSPSGTLSTSTGSSVVSSGLSATQIYTVASRDIYSFCQGRNSTATLNVNTINTYTVTGGNGCTATGVTVGLSGSDTAVTYQLYLDGSAIGGTVSGTGSAISFGTVSAEGIYTVRGVRGSCNATMNGADTIGTSPAITVGATPSICAPTTSAIQSYTTSAGTPTHYNIAWSSAAVTAGFANVTGASLGASITINTPASVTGTYNGSLTVTTGGCGSSSYPISIAIYPQPVGSITSANIPCVGYSTNIEITGTPGANIDYRVDGGSAIIATIPGGGVYNIVTGAITTPHTYVLYEVFNPACGNVYDTSVVISPIPMQWIGGTSGAEHDWNTATNWSCGFVPGATDNVLIPFTADYPAIGAAATGTTANLTIDSGVVVNIGNSGSLHVEGNLHSRGTVYGQGSIIMDGSTSQLISGISSAGNFEVDNVSGITIDTVSRLTVDSVLTITNGTLVTGDSLVIGASTVHTARIAPIAASGSIVGLATVKQNIQSNYRRYRFWSHPFTDTLPLSQVQRYIDITGTGGATNGFTTTGTNAPSAFRYNTLLGNSTLSYDPGWKPFTSASITAADSNKIARYQGIRIFIRGAKGEGLGYTPYTPSATVIAQWGNLNQGRLVIPLVKGSDPGKDYNLLGNPYASPVDIGTILYHAKVAGNIIGSFYVWNPALGAGGQFTTIPISTMSPTPYFIQANTAFEVRAAHNADTLVFNESDKGANATTVLLKTLPEYTTLSIYDKNYCPWDVLHIKFDENANPEQDRTNDADKLLGGDLNFYSLSADGKRQAIDVRPYLSSDVIPLGIISAIQQEFIIRAENVVLPEGGELYLHDKLLGTYTAMHQGTEYAFSIDKDAISQGNQRFELTMKPALIAQSTIFDVSILPNPATEEVKLRYKLGAAADVNIRLTDVNGVVLYQTAQGLQQQGVLPIQLGKLAAGVYLVELQAGDRKMVKRLIKE